MIGRRFGRLLVVARVPGPGRGVVACRCDCGAAKDVRGAELRNGQVKSCGCYRRERMVVRNLRHGAAVGGRPTPEWVTWRSMRQRCEDHRHKSFADYGGRGIAVCRRWRSFENFYADMGPRPSPQHQIDRKNNNRGYTPRNCRWATRSQQAINRRPRGRLSNGTFAPARTVHS